MSETIDFRTLFHSLQERRGMQGVPQGLTGAIVYMLACDAATGRKLFTGFERWLNLRRGGDGRTSLAWFGEVVASVLGEGVGVPYWKLEAHDADRVETALFELVDQFLSQDR